MYRTLLLSFIVSLMLPLPATAAQYEDALGRHVVLPRTPRRIISLVPSVTEILFTLGVEERIVAVTNYCTYPPAAQKLPKVGEYADPGLENILLFQPDLVFAAADMNRPALVRRLEELHIPVYVVYPQTVAETLKTIRNIGDVIGQRQAAEGVAADIEARIAGIEQQLSGQRYPGILACIMLQPLTVAGPETFVADIIRFAGGTNLVPQGPSRYPTWNSEALLSVDPEAVVVSSYPGQPDPELFFKHWPQLQATKNNRIIRIDADWIQRPGPRMILGIETLAKTLHPDISVDE